MEVGEQTRLWFFCVLHAAIRQQQCRSKQGCFFALDVLVWLSIPGRQGVSFCLAEETPEEEEVVVIQAAALGSGR